MARSQWHNAIEKVKQENIEKQDAAHNGNTQMAKAFDDAVPRALACVLGDVETNSKQRSVVCSFDHTTRDGAMRRERHECDAQDNGEKYINTVIDIVAFTCSVTEMSNEQGEFSTVPVLTLENSKGELLSIFSAPALRCFISRLRTHIIDGPLDESHPIKLKLVRRQTQSKRSMYWFERS